MLKIKPLGPSRIASVFTIMWFNFAMHQNGHRKYRIITYGCQMNKYDSEKIAGLLEDIGCAKTDNFEDSDIIVFNTCCVREGAADRLYGNLNHLKSLRKEKRDLIIAVGGCIAQNDKEFVLKRAPHVDIVFGTHTINEIPNLIAKHKQAHETLVDIKNESENNLVETPAVRQERARAWVPVTVGCDNYCSYCVVPYVRGAEKSIEIEMLDKQVDGLIGDGVREITLLGQNVNSYGRDIYGAPRFAELLSLMSKKPLTRIRFTTSHPKDLEQTTIDAIASSGNVCKHIHLPVQAGSDRILGLMNRKYSREEYLAKVKAIRDAIPDCSITTDIIVGFPGETGEDFADTLSLVEQCLFDAAYTFIYSPRQGTKAYDFDDDEPKAAKNERFRRLLDIQNKISLDRNKRHIGQVKEVYVESVSKKDARLLTGRTDENKIVHFSGVRELIGDFANVRIVDVQTWYMLGEIQSNR